MDLILDVGNSAVKAAWFEGEALQDVFRLGLSPTSASSVDWRECFEQLTHVPRRVGISSVVPAASERIRQALHSVSSAAPFFVEAEAGTRLPFALAYRTPATLGADRLAAAVAAWHHYGDAGRSMLVLDAGTAVTCEVVRAGPGGDATYEGGAIAPGPALLRRALSEGTAQLPSVSFECPSSPIGASTHEALQSGLFYGFLGAVEGLMDRLTDTLKADDPEAPPPLVVATGGWGASIEEHCPERIHHHDPHLVLRGARALMQMNAEAA